MALSPSERKKLAAFAEALGTDIKLLTAHIGNLSALDTADKTSLAAALNEVLRAAQNAAASGGASINDGDTQSRLSTLSAHKIGELLAAAVEQAQSRAVAQAKNDILGGSVAAELDTLREIAAELQNGKSVAETITRKLSEQNERIAALEAVIGQDLVAVYTQAKGA